MMTPAVSENVVTCTSDFVDADDLRTSFALAMSAMYKTEVPLYGDLVRIVRTVNNENLHKLPDSHVESTRLDLERHGAIRLGTAYELSTVRRLFEVIGMYPVGYYDLSQAGLPMHATCFRPITTTALHKNPFRVFTTLLRPELLPGEGARDLALELLGRRNIFSDGLMSLLDAAEAQGGRLRVDQSVPFVQEAIKTFGWRPLAAANKQMYERLKEQHPILADIACFQSAHINHLTPRTLNIDVAHDRMRAEGLAVKERIEGPPSRVCPILLRQTSFLALEEQIRFPEPDGKGATNGSHKARFGEIEERGAAVTLVGRNLYDKLLENAMQEIANSQSSTPEEQNQIVAKTLAQFPDDWNELRKQGLVYFRYRCSPTAKVTEFSKEATREQLLAAGVLQALPITYEDFLPLSAAGIFQSNLGDPKNTTLEIQNACPDKAGYERAMRRSIIDSDSWYAEEQDASLRACARELGMSQGMLVDQVNVIKL
jgi:uncharacterized glyoxalase superfamily metalloenzyme YdcJ